MKAPSGKVINFLLQPSNYLIPSPVVLEVSPEGNCGMIQCSLQ